VGIRIQPLAERKTKSMKALVLGLAIALGAITAQAQRAPDPAPLVQQQLARTSDFANAAAKRNAAPDEADLLSHGHYKSSSGQEVHSPAKSVRNTAPAGASAQCRDGSYSFSQHRRGTCSHHGGVDAWL
jgi:hypothetical protein